MEEEKKRAAADAERAAEEKAKLEAEEKAKAEEEMAKEKQEEEERLRLAKEQVPIIYWVRERCFLSHRVLPGMHGGPQ